MFVKLFKANTTDKSVLNQRKPIQATHISLEDLSRLMEINANEWCLCFPYLKD